MNLKKIIVYDDDTLFNILDEIKEKFDLNLINADKKNFDKISQAQLLEYLVITKSKLSRYDNQLIISEFPIKIIKLIEIINLKFLKMRFNVQSSVSIGTYTLNLNSREISKNNKIIDLTERELNLILFLKKCGSAVKINELQKKVWEYEADLETHTVETHIYRLRKKIFTTFNNNEFIVSKKNGYQIE